MKSILDKSFSYTPALDTNIRATFARLREEAAAQAEAQRLAEAAREEERRRAYQALLEKKNTVVHMHDKKLFQK